MNAERRREPQLDRWFAERAATLREPREGFEEMLAMIAVTPQRHRRWWPSIPGTRPGNGPDERLGRLAMVMSTGLAAVLLLGVFGFLAQGFLAGPAEPLPPPPATTSDALMPPAAETLAPSDAEATAEAETPAPTVSDPALERYGAILAGLETKAVAPGVTRVVADATGHRMRNIDQLVVAPDGRVWITKREWLVEVGERGGYEHAGGELFAGRDGRLFSISMGWVASPGVSVLDDDGWQPLDAWPEAATPGWPGWLEGTTESGELWATSPGDPRLARYDGDAWTEFHPSDMDVDWPAGVDLDLVGVVDLDIASDGSVWAALRNWPDPREPWDERGRSVPVDTLVRYDGVSWKELSSPGGLLLPADTGGQDPRTDVFHPGRGSSMWVQRTYPDAELMHWDGEGWSTVLAPRSSDLVIDREDRVWSLKEEGDPALLMLDGSTWSTYGLPAELGETRALQLAPDDSLWVLSESREPYILHPDEMEPDGGAQS